MAVGPGNSMARDSCMISRQISEISGIAIGCFALVPVAMATVSHFGYQFSHDFQDPGVTVAIDNRLPKDVGNLNRYRSSTTFQVH